MQLKLKRYGDNDTITKYNVVRQRSIFRYQQTLSEKLQHLSPEDESLLDGKWDKIKESYITSLEICIGEKEDQQQTMDKGSNHRHYGRKNKHQSTQCKNKI